MATPLEHFLFREYSIAVKNWIGENCFLSSYPKEENVLVAYTTPDRAWAKYIFPVLNGATFRPNINFRLTSMEYAEGENLLGFVRENRKHPDENVYKTLKPLLVYRLTYSATIYTRQQSEMDILLYQILAKAHKNAKAYFIVDGQWAELVASGIRDETNLEPGETADVVKRFGLDFVVPRAYLPLEYTEVEQITNLDFIYDV